MELHVASSPEMEAAHGHRYVQTTVDILIKERSLLRPTAQFLRKYTSSDMQGFAESLDAIRLYQARSDTHGSIIVSNDISLLIQTLTKLYQQKQEQIRYQRGAIVERLACKLISHRYDGHDELCETNRKFVENFRPVTVQEVDVAALSTKRKKMEGYECKVKPSGFKDFDGKNLGSLYDSAQELEYRINVGFVAFDNSHAMAARLKKYEFPSYIKLYGSDNIAELQNLSALEN